VVEPEGLKVGLEEVGVLHEDFGEVGLAGVVADAFPCEFGEVEEVFEADVALS
jgi:hypothetical protein